MVAKPENKTNINLDVLEEDLYGEFKDILEAVCTEVNETIIESEVFDPLEKILGKFDQQFSIAKTSVEKMQEIQKQFDAAKKSLSNELQGNIQIVSNQVIKDSVMAELQKVLKKYENQSASLIKQSDTLTNLLDNLKETEKALVPAIQKAVENKTHDYLITKVLLPFENIHSKFIGSFTGFEKTNNESTKLVGELTSLRENIHSDVNNSYDKISERVSEHIRKELGELYQSFSGQVEVLESKNEALQQRVGKLDALMLEAREWNQQYLEKFAESEAKAEELKLQNKTLSETVQKNHKNQLYFLAGLAVMNIAILVGVFM